MSKLLGIVSRDAISSSSLSGEHRETPPQEMEPSDEASSITQLLALSDSSSNELESSNSSSISETSTSPTTVTEPAPEADSSEGIFHSDIDVALVSTPITIPGKWKVFGLPRKFVFFLVKAAVLSFGLQTTAWFVLVLAAVATSITTTYSLQGPLPDPPPEIGDSTYYSLLSQSIIAVCSLYYLMVPYLRGDEELPVRALFYVCWTLSLAGAITAPLIYAQDWTKCVWASFGSALAQLAATAFLFEYVGT